MNIHELSWFDDAFRMGILNLSGIYAGIGWSPTDAVFVATTNGEEVMAYTSDISQYLFRNFDASNAPQPPYGSVYIYAKGMNALANFSVTLFDSDGHFHVYNCTIIQAGRYDLFTFPITDLTGYITSIRINLATTNIVVSNVIDFIAISNGTSYEIASDDLEIKVNKKIGLFRRPEIEDVVQSLGSRAPVYTLSFKNLTYSDYIDLFSLVVPNKKLLLETTALPMVGYLSIIESDRDGSVPFYTANGTFLKGNVDFMV